MYLLPRDILGVILQDPRSARAFSYTCKEAARACAGLFTVHANYSDDRIKVLIEGVQLREKVIFNGDSIRTPSARWTSMIAAFPEVIIYSGNDRLRSNIGLNIVIVVSEDDAFLSTIDQVDKLIELAIFPVVKISAIYRIASICNNFGGSPISEDKDGINVVICGDRFRINHTNMAATDIKGGVILLKSMHCLQK